MRGSAIRWDSGGRPVPHVPGHILVAEDDDELRRLVSQALRAEGYRVTECVDGTQLVSRLGTYILFGPPSGYDLIISDIVMPGASALEILDALRDCVGSPDVILVTAFPSPQTHRTARQLGVSALLEKPFELDQIVAAATEVIESHSRQLIDGHTHRSLE